MPTVSLPVEGLEQIWALFPGVRPGTRPRYLPAAPAHAAAGLYTDEAYMAPVRDLVRREEALNSSGRSPSGRPSLRCRSTSRWLRAPTAQASDQVVQGPELRRTFVKRTWADYISSRRSDS